MRTISRVVGECCVSLVCAQLLHWYVHSLYVHSWYQLHSYFGQHVVSMQSRYIRCGVSFEPLRQRNVFSFVKIQKIKQSLNIVEILKLCSAHIFSSGGDEYWEYEITDGCTDDALLCGVIMSVLICWCPQVSAVSPSVRLVPNCPPPAPPSQPPILRSLRGRGVT